MRPDEFLGEDQRDRDLRVLRVLEDCDCLSDVEDAAFAGMLTRLESEVRSTLSRKQRQWAVATMLKYDLEDAEPAERNRAVPRGREVPTPAALASLPKRPPGRPNQAPPPPRATVPQVSVAVVDPALGGTTVDAADRGAEAWRGAERTAAYRLERGEVVQVPGGSGRVYELLRTGVNGAPVYSCTCPAWRNQKKPVALRTCKHLAGVRTADAEKARIVRAENAASDCTCGRVAGVREVIGRVFDRRCSVHRDESAVDSMDAFLGINARPNESSATDDSYAVARAIQRRKRREREAAATPLESRFAGVDVGDDPSVRTRRDPSRFAVLDLGTDEDE